MSDDVNYVSDYFYTGKQGQIGSAPAGLLTDRRCPLNAERADGRAGA